jgi:hypothetical protein
MRCWFEPLILRLKSMQSSQRQTGHHASVIQTTDACLFWGSTVRRLSAVDHLGHTKPLIKGDRCLIRRRVAPEL